MSLTAITRDVSPGINRCELSFHARTPIDFPRAVAQHQTYREYLASAGAHVISLPAEPDLPDSVFVEDPAVVVDEVAVILNMGAPSRRREAKTLADALAPYRPLKFLEEPATMDGGDVLRIGRSILVGLSGRTNRDGVEQLRHLLASYDYEVQPIEMHDCLHLKSACSYLGGNKVLVNRAWVEVEKLQNFDLVDVPVEEPNAANILLINDQVIMPASFPRTAALLRERGFQVHTLDVSELQKAEAGVTCCSLIFRTQADSA